MQVKTDYTQGGGGKGRTMAGAVTIITTTPGGRRRPGERWGGVSISHRDLSQKPTREPARRKKLCNTNNTNKKKKPLTRAEKKRRPVLPGLALVVWEGKVKDPETSITSGLGDPGGKTGEIKVEKSRTLKVPPKTVSKT